MALSEALGGVMRRSGVGSKTLSKLTGIPRTAIDNWRDGTVRRPRHWRPMLQIARVLSLSRDETDELLVAAGYPRLAVLGGELPPYHPDREHLCPWLTPQPEPPAPSRCQLRAPAGDFVGRSAELEAVLAALRSTRDAPIIGLRGMAGIGKTELALLAANRVRDTYPDAQLVVHLHGVGAEPLPPAQALRQIIHALTPDARLDDDLDTLQRRYCSVLGGQRVLIVADDACDAGQVRHLLPPAGSALLVTSRQRFTLPGMRAVDLEQFAEVEAVRMLRTICDRVSDAQARTIARACGYLPLALRISGGLLANDPALPVAEHIAALLDRCRPLARLRDPDDAHLDIEASLSLSYDRLDDPARAVFRQLSVFVADFGSELAAEVVRAPGDVGEACRLLLRRSLVGYDPIRRRWRLHDLVRELAAGHLAAAGEVEAAMWRYAEACLRTAESIQRDYLSGGDAVGTALASFDTERPHLDAARAWAAEHAGAEQGDRLLVADATASYHHIGFMRYDRRHEIAPFAERALEAARRLGDDRGQGVVLNRLGQLHLDLGDAGRAIAAFGEQLDLLRAAGDIAGQARALNNLGNAHLLLGDPHRALRLHEEQLVLVHQMDDLRGEAMARCNLGRARVSLGETDLGLAELQPALAIARRLGDAYGEAAVLADIGAAHLAAGDPLPAGALLERSLAIIRALGDRHGESRVLADLALAAAALGQQQEGLKHGEAAVAIAREIGAPHAEATGLRARGACLAAAGEPERARISLERALAGLRTLGDRGGEAECQWQLGLSLLGDDRQRALPLLAAAVAYRREIGHSRAEQWDQKYQAYLISHSNLGS
ncbi:tetratricopeptide (TPR) repeat protein [Allocatelliglobosispora scoriae]|uniref:Tetratricopeptide (TPR) repeat protein n=1 Tax=Allocatelliglobosispora scoriae TaxID=643052 RepID=A0A841BSU6_9ACTN|nr:tetratricopeptide repeat protein [Allocatelliglobosispora scoriae]MBB5869993.1 tetratricopeptide (TPR) repeat protein [Allocatelliglobosispora scoriae]